MHGKLSQFHYLSLPTVQSGSRFDEEYNALLMIIYRHCANDVTDSGSHYGTCRPYEKKCSIAATIHILGTLHQNTLSPHWSIVFYRPVLANGLSWPGDQHRVSEGGRYLLMVFSIGNHLKMQIMSQTI